MKIFNGIINILFAFLLIFAIIGTIIFNIVFETILNKQYTLDKLEETEFYIQLEREVKSGFEDYIYQSGLPVEIFDEIYNGDMIKDDVNSIADYIYEGTDIRTSEDIIRDNLDNKINNYVKENKIPMVGENKDNIEKFKNLITDTYKANVNVSGSGIVAVKDTIDFTQKTYERFKYMPIVSLIVIIVLIILINIKNISSIINTIAISLLSTGILIKLFEWIILKNVDIDNLVILSQSLSNLIINTMKDILYKISNYGMIFIIIGVTGVIIGSMIKVSKKD